MEERRVCGGWGLGGGDIPLVLSVQDWIVIKVSIGKGKGSLLIILIFMDFFILFPGFIKGRLGISGVKYDDI